MTKVQLPAVRPALADRVVSYFDPVRGAALAAGRMLLASREAREDTRDSGQPRNGWRRRVGGRRPLRPKSSATAPRPDSECPRLGRVSSSRTSWDRARAHDPVDRDLLGLQGVAADDWRRSVERE
jgi:hypothetical protein